MRFKKIYFVAIAAMIVMLAVQGCTNDDESNSARVQLKLVDAPGDYLEVNVKIVDIQYNKSDSEAGWVSFGTPKDYPINVDLTTLIAGNSLLLTDQIIPSGMLKQIRLVLGDGNTLKIEGQAEMMALNTPSAMQSGLKLNMNTTLEPGFSYTFILDWDVQKSVVMTGSGMYNLKPVIRVNTAVNSGSISGIVVKTANSIDIPMDLVTVGFVNNSDESMNGTTTTDEAGKFLIQGLKTGTYTLTINKAGYNIYTKADVSVTVGNVTNINKITLLPAPTTP